MSVSDALNSANRALNVRTLGLPCSHLRDTGLEPGKICFEITAPLALFVNRMMEPEKEIIFKRKTIFPSGESNPGRRGESAKS